MTIQPYNSDSNVASLNSGDDLIVQIDSQRADKLNVFVDDGSGGNPDGYDLKVEYYSTETDSWFTEQELSSSGNQDPDLARDVKESLTAQKVKITLNANSSATYRLVVESYEVL